MPFTATWRQVEITLSEVERKRCVTYIWNLKYNTDESICETETGSQTQRPSLWPPRGGGWEKGGFGV